ncbi:hypothetical protein [Floccifex sp.]|uniref:hypothetical protein n=1 Tax=Floccifex sp. TaxID=2815810 RepID=UPI002A761AFB|nr:hypothetical protein [Floccifex sp.]MDD7281074.1 hypothetical protein [Erysipelotrichaceae bacterium]MDY2957342.1 hypothetical protein [Floccifex sp.]
MGNSRDDSSWDWSKEPENYEEWLLASNCEDNPTNKEWYECEIEKRAEFIDKHKDWWKKF